ncbi:hypothetical protein GL4_2833 [Methyloceanibacter caenitepidi]|uniref:Uncharacterized protein n=2 Tax=Methyloceanibacter caenitepidi TaxID=1384459 RepID=A0A0A8K640_9HYPH|nr:hypothetical protein GL4_2833 [Methyloceanibacter caenitepidi]
MPVPMPSAVVLIVCKTVMLPADQHDVNSKWTGYENRTWAIENSMMQCRRQEVQLYDQSEAMGAAAQPFNQQRCQRASLMLGVEWDQAHKSSSYRFWRVACPVPIVDTRTGEVIAWKMPECGHRDTVICEVDTAI